MKLINVHLRTELNHMSKRDSLFSVSDEESLGHKRCVLIKNLRL